LKIFKIGTKIDVNFAEQIYHNSILSAESKGKMISRHCAAGMRKVFGYFGVEIKVRRPFFCGCAPCSSEFYFRDRTAVNILFIMLHLRSIPHIYVQISGVGKYTSSNPETPLLFREKMLMNAPLNMCSLKNE